MKKEETAQIIKMITVAYPRFVVEKETLEIWHRFLKDQDFEKVVAKTEDHIRKNPFPPSISEVLIPNEVTRNRPPLVKMTKEEEEFLDEIYRKQRERNKAANRK